VNHLVRTRSRSKSVQSKVQKAGTSTRAMWTKFKATSKGIGQDLYMKFYHEARFGHDEG
jgi:hypothetical protein